MTGTKVYLVFAVDGRGEDRLLSVHATDQGATEAMLAERKKDLKRPSPWWEGGLSVVGTEVAP